MANAYFNKPIKSDRSRSDRSARPNQPAFVRPSFGCQHIISYTEKEKRLSALQTRPTKGKQKKTAKGIQEIHTQKRPRISNKTDDKTPAFKIEIKNAGHLENAL